MLSPAQNCFVGQFAFRFLGEEILGDAQSRLLFAIQLLDDGVIVVTVLESAACVDITRYSKPIEFPHEMTRGIDLIIKAELRSFDRVE